MAPTRTTLAAAALVAVGQVFAQQGTAASSQIQAASVTGSQTSLSVYYTTAKPSAVNLGTTSYSYTFTVTTPTSYWSAPTFSTAKPVPTCSSNMCSASPGLNGQTCLDASGVEYGIICNTQFYGTVITNSGKVRLLRGREDLWEEEAMGGAGRKRDYAGFFEDCADFCDNYDPSQPSNCVGAAYERGYCMAFDTITGTYQKAGGIAAIRQG
ncbi:hypothetical protein LTR62_007016 [Meristemomyces frigidus]|uniref:Uncharacterized protein n=1 Tax=Meristemomyces frigidus TaxID=1508187 RepID=A0AAN7YI72_9PEZI|nr:hypothetical protein LTR62_007016 [Meristemomyces frigidus]